MPEPARWSGRKLAGVFALAGAAPLAAWACWASLSHDYGQDAALYTMLAVRHAAGEQAALRLGGLAPGVPFVLSLLIQAGLSPLLAFRTAAGLGHAALLAASAAFALAVGREAGLSRSGAALGAVLTLLLFGLAPNVIGYGIEPLTDQPSLALLLFGLTLLRETRRGPSLLIGCIAAACYWFRYVSLGQSLLLLAGHLAALRCAGRRLAPAALISLVPLVLSVASASVWLSGPEFGVSYGANTQLALNIALQQRREAVGDHVYHLEEDDTLTFARIDPAHPEAWNFYYWVSRREFTQDGRALPRLRALLASPFRSLVRTLEELQQLLADFGPATPGVGGACWLGLLVATRRSPLLWTATALAASVVSGGALAYLMEARYVWLPGLVCLAALPVALGRVWRGTRRAPQPALRTAGWTATLLIGTTLALAAGRVATDLSAATQRLRRLQIGQQGVDRLLEPAARRAARAVAAGARPFSTPTVASARAGQVLASGGRWLPLPVIPLSPRVWARSTPEQRQAWLDRMLAVMRRGGVRFVVLRGGDYHQPSLQPLFARARELPPEFELVGDVFEASGAKAARVLRLKPQAPELEEGLASGDPAAAGRVPSADQL